MHSGLAGSRTQATRTHVIDSSSQIKGLHGGGWNDGLYGFGEPGTYGKQAWSKSGVETCPNFRNLVGMLEIGRSSIAHILPRPACPGALSPVPFTFAPPEKVT